MKIGLICLVILLVGCTGVQYETNSPKPVLDPHQKKLDSLQAELDAQKLLISHLEKEIASLKNTLNPINYEKSPRGVRRNEKCEDIEEIEIFQTLNEGALAHVCEKKSYTDCMPGITVWVPKQKGIELWDNKRIKAPKNMCIEFRGVYKYESKSFGVRTVPVVHFVNQ